MKKALEQSKGESDKHLYSWVGNLLTKIAGPILDVGCGRGTFLKFLNESGKSSLTGCDGHDFLSGEGYPFDFKKTDLNQKLPFQNGSFECVTAIEVIEHLENPRHFVREIARLLRSGGIAIITTPNNESLTSLLSLGVRGYSSAFSDHTYPAHITPLFEIDLKRIMSEAGFKEIRISWSDRGRIPGSAWHWQNVSRRFSGKRFSDQIMIQGIKT